MPQSLKDLKKLEKLNLAANDAWAKFQEFNTAALDDGAIPKKYKELISLGVALTTQCWYCLEVHRENARKAGATQEEIAEVTLVAAAIRAGGAYAHGTQLLDD